MQARLITAVVRDDAVVAGSNLPVAWWSFTKVVLAAAALVLVSRGRLHLDAPMHGRPFTLRQMLQHRAGLSDYGSLAAYHASVASGEIPWAIDDMLARAGAQRLIAEPGERFAYSNIGYLFVRQAIEDSCGALVGSALEELVLAPLGIEAVTLACLPADLACTAWGNLAGYHPGWVYHGLLIGSAGAAALLLHRLLAGGLLPPAMLREMCTPEPVFGTEPGRPWSWVGYGLGLGICKTEAGLFAGHTGGGPGSVSAVYRRIKGGPRDRITAAAFAPADALGTVEAEAVALACGRDPVSRPARVPAG